MLLDEIRTNFDTKEINLLRFPLHTLPYGKEIFWFQNEYLIYEIVLLDIFIVSIAQG